MPETRGEAHITGSEQDLALIGPRVRHACQRLWAAMASADRSPDSVALLLATKTQPPAAVRAAVLAARDCGIEPAVGENRVQELVAKAGVFAELGVAAHLIGPLQSNKISAALTALGTPGLAGACIQTVASLDLAHRLARRTTASAPLPVMVQVNVSGESAKSGVDPRDGVSLAEQIADVPELTLAGFMTVGARSADSSVVIAGFDRLRALRDTVWHSGLPGTERAHDLSMGMSGDLDWAVASGATMVRLGTAVFGRRPAVSY